MFKLDGVLYRHSHNICWSELWHKSTNGILPAVQKVSVSLNAWESEINSQGQPLGDTEEGPDMWGERQQTRRARVCLSPHVRWGHLLCRAIPLTQQSKWEMIPVQKSVSLPHGFCTFHFYLLSTLCSEAEWQGKWMCLHMLVYLMAWEQCYGLGQPWFKSFPIQHLGGQRIELEENKTTWG